VAYNDLREWIAALDKAGELKRITAEVDPVLEVAEITDRVSKWGAKNGRGPGGPALLFENVKGHAGHKILINQFGSERRMNLALGSNSLDEIAERLQQMMDVKTPQDCWKSSRCCRCWRSWAICFRSGFRRGRARK